MSFVYNYYASATRRRNRNRRFLFRGNKAEEINKIIPGSAINKEGETLFTGSKNDAYTLSSQLHTGVREI